MRTISQIIEAAGGPQVVSAAIPPRPDGKKMTSDAVRKWPQIGIPDRHWPVLIELAQATPDELFEANRTARDGGSDTPGSATPGDAAMAPAE